MTRSLVLRVRATTGTTVETSHVKAVVATRAGGMLNGHADDHDNGVPKGMRDTVCMLIGEVGGRAWLRVAELRCGLRSAPLRQARRRVYGPAGGRQGAYHCVGN